jgi:membrane protein YqaA with SNARE-associated domain
MDWLLFGSALSSATVLPGGSELVLVARLRAGADPVTAVLTATAGNVLGSVVTFVTGLLGLAAVQRRWLRIAPERLDEARRRFARWGWPGLLLAWLPGVGDALCLAAGAMRFPVTGFLVLVTAGKAGRYAALALAASP